MSFQTLKNFRTQIKIVFLWNPRAFWPSIDSKGPTTFKVQKHTKNIDKIVHVTSVVQPFMKLREYFLCSNNLYNDFIQQFFSSM